MQQKISGVIKTNQSIMQTLTKSVIFLPNSYGGLGVIDPVSHLEVLKELSRFLYTTRPSSSLPSYWRYIRETISDYDLDSHNIEFPNSVNTTPIDISVVTETINKKTIIKFSSPLSTSSISIQKDSIYLYEALLYILYHCHLLGTNIFILSELSTTGKTIETLQLSTIQTFLHSILPLSFPFQTHSITTLE